MPAWCTFDMRISFYPGQSLGIGAQRRRETVREAARNDGFLANNPPEVVYHGFQAEPYILEGADAPRAVLEKTHQLAFGETLPTRAITATTDARFFGLYAGIPALVYGPAAEDYHGFDERVNLQFRAQGDAPASRSSWRNGAASRSARPKMPKMETKDLWSIRIDFALKPDDAQRIEIETVMEALGIALSSFEDGKGWRMETIADAKPRAAEVRAALKPFGVVATIDKVPQRNWVLESRKGLPPLIAGPFFIHGEHDRNKRPKKGIALEIDAGMAFGTGRHETTMGCIKALLRLKKTHKFKRILDVGTGTGILAFAAWHLFGQPVIAGDNDKDAVRVAKENAVINGLKKHVRIVSSDGYKAKSIRTHAPYDLITANILANPLIALAPALARNLARNGRAVLSGLMNDQAKDVLAAHRAVGLELDFRIRLGQWSVLVLKKARR